MTKHKHTYNCKYLKAQTNKNSSRTNDDDDDDDALSSVDENARDVISISRELFIAGRRIFTTELAAAAAAAAQF